MSPDLNEKEQIMERRFEALEKAHFLASKRLERLEKRVAALESCRNGCFKASFAEIRSKSHSTYNVERMRREYDLHDDEESCWIQQRKYADGTSDYTICERCSDVPSFHG